MERYDLPSSIQTRSKNAWLDPIQGEMEAVNNRLSHLAEGHHEWLSEATARILSAGGKRVRPALCLLTTGHLGLRDERTIAFAAGVELLHTATLVHDDVLDQAPRRRGVPTLNANGSAHAAILVGDYLFARASDLIASIDDIQLMKLFAMTLMTLVNGEISQHFSPALLDRERYQDRIYAKTAAMFVLSTEGAALLGNASPTERETLIQFGHKLGMAFQITDDILDFTGDPQVLGKPTGSDLIQGIPTLPVIHYAAIEPDDPSLLALSQGAKLEPGALQRLIQRVADSAAIDHSLQEAGRYIAEAHHALDALPPTVYTHALHQLTDSCLERVSEETPKLSPV